MILYHGTGKCFPKFNRLSFFTESLGIAQEYAKMREYPRVVCCDVDLGRVLTITMQDMAGALKLKHGRMFTANGGQVDDEHGCRVMWGDIDAIVFAMLEAGDYDSALFKDVDDMTPDGSRLQDQYIVRDPSRIRFLHEQIATHREGRYVGQNYTPGGWEWHDCMEMAA